MRRHGRTALRLATLLVVPAFLSGCGITHLNDLNFRTDDRLHFTSPPDRSEQHPPFVVTWTMDDFTVEPPGSAPPSRDAGYFAVFVDQAPVPPDHTLDDIAKGDPECEADPDCPDRHYLAGHHVFTTSEDQIRIPLLPPVQGDPAEVQLHSIIVVLMDTSGHRIGESAWELDVKIPRLTSL